MGRGNSTVDVSEDIWVDTIKGKDEVASRSWFPVTVGSALDVSFRFMPNMPRPIGLASLAEA